MRRPFLFTVLALSVCAAAGAASAADGPLKLRCEGEGRRAVAETSRSYSSRNGSETRTALRDRVRADVVNLEIIDGHARIHMPSNLIPDIHEDDEDGWWRVNDLRMDGDRISGRFRINFANKPTFKIDRNHGDMELEGYQLSFRGECAPDTATERRF